MSFVLGLVVVGAFVTLGLAFTIGANDAANALGPAVGSSAMTMRQAVALGCVFEVLGVLLMGSFVSSTLKSDVVDPDDFSDLTSFASGMFAALLSSAVCLLLFTLAALPVSTTQTVVGGILGFGVVADNGVNASVMLKIVLTWFTSPLFSLGLGFLFFRAVQRAVFDRDDPAAASRGLVPHFFALTAGVLSGFVALVSAETFGLPLWVPFVIMCAVAAAAFVLARALLVPRLPADADAEAPFRWLIVLTAAAVAFAQGSNDVANAIGPYAVIVELHADDEIDKDAQTLKLWILVIGAVGLAAGLAVLGSRVIDTVGSKITRLTYSRGFAAQLSTAITVMILTYMAIPVSTTTTLIGAIAGVGYAVHKHEHLEVDAEAPLEDLARAEVDVARDPGEPAAAAGASSGSGVDSAAQASPADSPPPPASPSTGGGDPVQQAAEQHWHGDAQDLHHTETGKVHSHHAAGHGKKRVDLKLIGKIVASWFASVFASGVISAAIYATMEAVR